MERQISKINREDMLELTRRMTITRNCFGRIAGSYMDEEGFSDGTFNIHFLKLSAKEKEQNLAIAKTIPFSETNVNLKEYRFEKQDEVVGSMWQLLSGLKECELKNDALLDILYEIIGENYKASGSYAFYLLHGCYDVPLKGSDKTSQWESEEVYKFLVGAVCPVHGDYEPGTPEWGFLFPAFKFRSSDVHRIEIYEADPGRPHREMLKVLFREK